MFFAVISTFTNIFAQFIIKVFLSKFIFFNKVLIPKGTQRILGINFNFSNEITIGFLLQILIGILAGFFVKFLFDKFLVFENKSMLKETIKQFIIYGLLAVITTLIFIIFEFSFKILFKFPHSELLGGFIGLAIGYTVKFFLDKIFVFKA